MALSSFNFDTLQWKSNIPTSFFLDLVAKNSLPMKKKINGAEKTVDHNGYSKIYLQQGQTAQKVSQWEKSSHQQSLSWYIKKEQKYNWNI